jgi:glycosyltransferase involved in cell wall biosynthesis
MKSLRVLHWYTNFLGGGGVTNALLGLANAQAHLRAEVFVATTEASGNALYGSVLNHLGPEVKLVRWTPSWRLQRGKLVLQGIPSNSRKQLTDLKPDVVHIHGEFIPDNLRIPSLFQCPIVLTPQGAINSIVLQKSKIWSKRLYIAVARRLLYRKAVVHALTPMEQQHILQILPEAELYMIPQGPSVQMQAFLDDQTEAFRTPARFIRFLFVGRLDIYHKGLDILLEAFAQATQQLYRKALLTLVGPDWNGSMLILKELARKLGIEKYIHMPGTITGARLAEAFRQSHVYIQVSRYEGLPSSVTEALLFGKPAILTNATGTTSYPEISALHHILVVPPKVSDIASAITEAIEYAEELQQIADQNQSIIKNFFSWESIAAKHLQIYLDLYEHMLKTR